MCYPIVNTSHETSKPCTLNSSPRQLVPKIRVAQQQTFCHCLMFFFFTAVRPGRAHHLSRDLLRTRIPGQASFRSLRLPRQLEFRRSADRPGDSSFPHLLIVFLIVVLLFFRVLRLIDLVFLLFALLLRLFSPLRALMLLACGQGCAAC